MPYFYFCLIVLINNIFIFANDIQYVSNITVTGNLSIKLEDNEIFELPDKSNEDDDSISMNLIKYFFSIKIFFQIKFLLSIFIIVLPKLNKFFQQII